MSGTDTISKKHEEILTMVNADHIFKFETIKAKIADILTGVSEKEDIMSLLKKLHAAQESAEGNAEANLRRIISHIQSSFPSYSATIKEVVEESKKFDEKKEPDEKKEHEVKKESSEETPTSKPVILTSKSGGDDRAWNREPVKEPIIAAKEPIKEPTKDPVVQKKKSENKKSDETKKEIEEENKATKAEAKILEKEGEKLPPETKKKYHKRVRVLTNFFIFKEPTLYTVLEPEVMKEPKEPVVERELLSPELIDSTQEEIALEEKKSENQTPEAKKVFAKLKETLA